MMSEMQPGSSSLESKRPINHSLKETKVCVHVCEMKKTFSLLIQAAHFTARAESD